MSPVSSRPSWFGKDGTPKKNVIRRHAKPETKALALKLRRNQTPTETKVWLRLHALGLRLRSQTVILGWIADFYRPASKLVVEIDGGYHNDPVQIDRDVKRDAAMRRRGLRILRIPSSRVVNDFEKVISEILLAAGLSADVHTRTIEAGIKAPAEDAAVRGSGRKSRDSRDGRISQIAPNPPGAVRFQPAVDNAAAIRAGQVYRGVQPVR